MIALRKNARITQKALATRLAHWMTENSAINSKFGPSTFVFLRDDTTEPPSPVNYYFHNDNCITILKEVYADPKLTKAMIKSDDNVMKAFFGTAEQGHQIMSTLTEEDWNTKNIDWISENRVIIYTSLKLWLCGSILKMKPWYTSSLLLATAWIYLMPWYLFCL